MTHQSIRKVVEHGGYKPTKALGVSTAQTLFYAVKAQQPTEIQASPFPTVATGRVPSIRLLTHTYATSAPRTAIGTDAFVRSTGSQRCA